MKHESGSRLATLIAAIEADLLAGVYRAGEWLKQADLEERHAANRFDVRMALLELKTRGLVAHARNRGYRTVNPSRSEREDLLQMRAILEVGAIRMVAAKITPAALAELRRIVAEFARQMKEVDLERLRALNFLFHERLYQACGNELLAAQIKALRQRGLPGGGRGWGRLADIRRSHDDHRQMLRLLADGDVEALAQLTVDHLYRWRAAESGDDKARGEAT